ncbi:MAG: glyoxalase [Actinobacteria bacterium RBG_19FT_COMBO_54_7]|uniref:Glyoxalase n=1 Tax=Candidatus Solincola sediminis TaxID=1797199 RepID=A0A1F2WNP8_9ACTN|nr:MAG: glyoxalase [Candidatus Solincola sediminis]OFW59535.1 MAG: glyoxalase [Candidatus Solincola sediminis]OFW68720.1 MAG: glyoxalase [Actinobacteria bacterium RBG_19FT_COMBO_54_7]
MPRVIHFEIAVDDPDRAVAFYRDIFGWKIEKWEGPMDYWLCETGPEGEPGINGAIMRRTDPAQSTVNTIGVTSLTDSIAKVKERGGMVMTEEMEIPDVGRFVYCTDSEGNAFGMIQPEM